MRKSVVALILSLFFISVKAEMSFDKAIKLAIDSNPDGFFEDRSSGRKNLPIKRFGSGKLALDIDSKESEGKNLVSGLLSSMGSLSDNLKKTDHKKYGDVDFTFVDSKGKKHKVNCSVTQEYECGRISLIGCHSKSGAVVGPSGPDHNFRFIYDESLASDEQCYPEIVNDRRNRRNRRRDQSEGRNSSSRGASPSQNK